MIEVLLGEGHAAYVALEMNMERAAHVLYAHEVGVLELKTPTGANIRKFLKGRIENEERYPEAMQGYRVPAYDEHSLEIRITEAAGVAGLSPSPGVDIELGSPVLEMSGLGAPLENPPPPAGVPGGAGWT